MSVCFPVIRESTFSYFQYVSIEGFENSNARAIVVKGINVLLTLLQVLLLLLATAAQILKPFLRTPTRVVTTVSWSYEIFPGFIFVLFRYY